MKSAHFVVAALMAAALAAPPVEARTYVRWCSAAFRVLPLEGGLDIVRDTVRLDTFSARASGGAYIPNTIRLRAFRRAEACIRQAWADPLSGSASGVPEACTNRGGNGIYRFNPSPSLLGEMANRACHAWGADYRGRSVSVRVVADVWGDWGCGGKWAKDAVIALPAGDPYALYVPAVCDT